MRKRNIHKMDLNFNKNLKHIRPGITTHIRAPKQIHLHFFKFPYLEEAPKY